MALHSAGAVREKKQTMAELKLRRLTELNARLREDLERPRVKVSEACHSMIAYISNTKDFMVPSTWGQVDKREDPYAPIANGPSCCVIC
ncbi:GGL domain-domain-containing protein [Tuber borchii]|uniref:Guanine nucleotide-binding protein subunit gamma n=1 Tax=Tuber borchii TaxID=42251 RepID=A0A2T6ZG99_TUBBO|nr:GGL domain-domain-containing protein [Tuber borchii]